MAVVSEPVPLGTPAPAFTLPDLDGTPHALLDHVAAADGVVVVFACNHCPYVKHVEAELGRIAADHADRGIRFLAVCSNDVTTHPDDDVPGLRQQADRAGWGFPYLVDTSQEVARAYGAACTPDFFVYDGDGRLAYRGAMDDSSPGNGRPNDGAALRAALAHVLAGEPVPEPHVPAMGCGIKWRPDPA